jgi:hypothetical protein
MRAASRRRRDEARLGFNCRTAIAGGGPVKEDPRWNAEED